MEKKEKLIRQCRDILNNFCKEQVQHHEIIKRYDEVISQKVNKEAFEIYKMEVESKYIHKRRVEDHFEDLRGQLEKLDNFRNKTTAFQAGLFALVQNMIDKGAAKQIEEKLQ